MHVDGWQRPRCTVLASCRAIRSACRAGTRFGMCIVPRPTPPKHAEAPKVPSTRLFVPDFRCPMTHAWLPTCPAAAYTVCTVAILRAQCARTLSTLGAQWAYNGRTTGVPWTYNGRTMGAHRTYNGCIVDVQWTYTGRHSGRPKRGGFRQWTLDLS